MRNKNLDNAKWILTLLMILYHIQFVGNEKYRVFFMFFKNLGDCVVPAFAIISGFLFWSTVKDFNDLKGKYKRRVYSLLLPYVLWNLINTLFLNWNDGKRGVGLLDLNIWRNIILWDSSPHFWYIFMLMFWTVLSPILFILYKKKIGIICLASIQIAYFIYKGDAILHSRFIYILYTWAGLLGVYYPNFLYKLIISDNKKRKITISIISFVLYILVYFAYAVKAFEMNIQVWLYAIRAILLLIVLLNIPESYFGRLTKYKYSFWLFAMHYWGDANIQSIMGIFVSNAIVIQVLTFVIVVGIGIVSGIIVDRIIPVLFGELTGNRGINRSTVCGGK